MNFFSEIIELFYLYNQVKDVALCVTNVNGSKLAKKKKKKEK